MSRDIKFYSAAPTVLHLSSLKTLSKFSACEYVCSEKKIIKQKKQKGSTIAVPPRYPVC